jgi:hypothetical protein
MVYEVTNPSTQRIRRTIAIVLSILVPLAISWLVKSLVDTAASHVML